MKTLKQLRWRVAQWLEIRWWQRYLRSRDAREYANRKAAYWQRVFSVLAVNPPAGQRILDVGCGPAGVFMVLNQHAVDAVDPLLECYAALLPDFQPETYPWTRFHALPIESFSGRGGYDYTFCFNAVNHVADWAAALDRLVALTRPGGLLVLGVDVHRHAGLKRIFRALPGDLLHPHQHDRADYRQALRGRGLTILREHTWRAGTIFDYWLIVCRTPAAE